MASAAQLQGFYGHLQRVLDRIDFLKAKPPVKLMRKIVRIFNRTQLSAEEINILRGILTTVEHRLDEVAETSGTCGSTGE
jgi:tRNA C32,U32 (ribose-2'-O)-methylase TrmJ